MALIFDRFPSVTNAASFAEKVKETYGRDSVIHTDEIEAATDAFFPFELSGSVVIVERETYDDEEKIIALVKSYGGEFAGT